MNLYVGNLSWGVDDDSLRTFFETYGEVTDARVITDRETGRSRGFGFVEMAEEGAKKAIADSDTKELDGRVLKINEAKPREPRPSRY